MHLPVEVGSAETTRLGRYELVAVLGRGAMGVVYKAFDPVLERNVAVKTVNMALEREERADYEARFNQEARAAGGLNHPNIVTVYDIGKSDSIAYMAMEFIEGEELRMLLEQGRLPVAQAVSIAAQVAEGLAFAHERGVVHRDIKPGNIMVAPHRPVKITDFGIARKRTAESLTLAGTMLGSPKYMSPEQVLGRRADHRSDIFSLGVILYEMLTGAPPFTGDSVTAVMYQIAHLAPPAPSALNRGVPEMLDWIVAKMIAKPLEERYPSAGDMARDLRECERMISADRPVRALPVHPVVSFSAGSAPAIIDGAAKNAVLEQTFNRTRREDGSPQPVDETDVAEREESAQPAGYPTLVQSLPGLVARRRRGWDERDWWVVGGAALLGSLVGVVLALT